MCYREFRRVPHIVYGGDVSGIQECVRAVPASLCVSVGRGCLYALCELRKYGLTSLQHLCHPLYKSLLSDLCQGDKWHEILKWAVIMFLSLFCVCRRQMKLKVCFTGKEKKKSLLVQSLTFVCLEIWCLSVKTIVVSFRSPLGLKKSVIWICNN